MEMELVYSALTDVGRVRTNNEDAVRVDVEHGIAVLADGMGGYNAGEVASAMAVNLIADELGRWLHEAATVRHGNLCRQRQSRHLRGRQHPRRLRRHGHHAGDGGAARQHPGDRARR